MDKGGLLYNIRRPYLSPRPAPSLAYLSSLPLLFFFSASILFTLVASETSQSHVPSLSLQYSLTHSFQSLLQCYPTKGILTFPFKTVNLRLTLVIQAYLFLSCLALLKHKLHEGRDFCSLLHAQHLEECLANSRCLLLTE